MHEFVAVEQDIRLKLNILNKYQNIPDTSMSWLLIKTGSLNHDFTVSMRAYNVAFVIVFLWFCFWKGWRLLSIIKWFAYCVTIS